MDPWLVQPPPRAFNPGNALTIQYETTHKTTKTLRDRQVKSMRTIEPSSASGSRGVGLAKSLVRIFCGDSSNYDALGSSKSIWACVGTRQPALLVGSLFSLCKLLRCCLLPFNVHSQPSATPRPLPRFFPKVGIIIFHAAVAGMFRRKPYSETPKVPQSEERYSPLAAF